MAVNKLFVESGKKNDFDTEQWKENLSQFCVMQHNTFLKIITLCKIMD